MPDFIFSASSVEMSLSFSAASTDVFAIVWASSKLRRSTSVIATSFCLWSLCGGNKAGLNYLIISELSEAEMEKLEGLLRERANSSGRGRMCGSVE